MTVSLPQVDRPPKAGGVVDIDIAAVGWLRPDTNTEVSRVYKELAEGAGGRESLARPGVAAALLGTLAARLRLGPPRVENAKAAARRGAARAAESGLTWLAACDAAYPDRLWQIADPPPALWIRGCRDALDAAAVAIVGARDATPAGLRIARQLASELAGVGLTIVSGLARGIDGAAHQGALDADGTTIAVLGCGADVIYPRQHVALAGGITPHGALVSECAPGALPLPFRFPLRNRVISGLSRAVVVIEAGEKSGSLITARAALEQGRDVLAVPGNVASGRNRGAHALIKDGARLVETVEDVLEEIGWQGSRDLRVRKSHIQSNLESIMAAGEGYTVDDLAETTGRAAADLLIELSGLELDGRVVRTGGGHFTKT